MVGIGTWKSERAPRPRVIEAVRAALDAGATHVDTAELYGDGQVEEMLGEALDGRRQEVFLVSKVRPDSASRHGTLRACEASLRRLRTDRLDCYLLHWPGSHPLADTIAAFEELVANGKILSYGVSNFDSPHRIILAPIFKFPDGGSEGFSRALLSGWNASAIVEMVSGAPLSAVLSSGASDANLGLLGGRQRPNLTGDPNTSGGDEDRVVFEGQTSARWFDANAFANPGAGAYGAYSIMQRELGAARVGMVMYLGPLYSAVLAWLVLGEQIEVFHLVGGALILPGIYLSTKS